MTAEIQGISIGGAIIGTAVAVKLLEMVQKFAGGALEPVRKIADAQAEKVVSLINQSKEFELDLRQRAFQRFENEQLKQQENMEDVTREAIPQLKGTAEPEKMEADWITNFYNKCRDVSNKEKQAIWSRVLAGEANKPGSFSIRSINALHDLGRLEIEMLSTLRNFAWNAGPRLCPLIFDANATIYNENGFTFDLFQHVESVGFIQTNRLHAFLLTYPSAVREVVFADFDQQLSLEPVAGENSVMVGSVFLTRTALELMPVLGLKAHPVEGFFEYVKKRWANYKPVETTPVVMNVSMTEALPKADPPTKETPPTFSR